MTLGYRETRVAVLWYRKTKTLGSTMYPKVALALRETIVRNGTASSEGIPPCVSRGC